MKKKLLAILISCILIPLSASAHSEEFHVGDQVPPHGEKKVTIYFNEQCHGCSEYLHDLVAPYLTEQGYEIRWQDYINDPSIREVMFFRAEKLAIPLELQSHIMVYFEPSQTIVGGHLPLSLMEQILNRDESLYPAPLIVSQDEMVDFDDAKAVSNTNYYVYSPGYEVQSYSLEQGLTSYQDWFEVNQDNQMEVVTKGLTLPLVLGAGFVDGLNPCAFGVLFFFIAVLAALKRTKKNILLTGGVYIIGIFLAYLLIGFGLIKAINVIPSHHFAAKVSVALLVLVGSINLLNLLLPSFKLGYKIPRISKSKIKEYLIQGTYPAAFIGGFLVGLCTFPCSGGIYVGIIGLLSISTSYWLGVGFLLLYNLMFVLPLVIILLLGLNPLVLNKLKQLKSKHSKVMHYLSVVLIFVLALIIYLWL
ncbi:hypothetical protein COT97_03365 [Candidatus Falkowbacteria bacterium CG10_big_fil_rev_8_21_14_0_10_39_11]|uniref:Uncharacterized protein n=1 Tax=Candidatus Falkowbacteria bacterium CG10_big_fil_rev_8_21_14_0_10_39_11 TaxID=1974565 RepID=A0A2H0V4N9_9BACT|nr:MAG: hypothetical protein COT97_03365 [Candidatus Falkowbacteria bacterium CG10_big_fil_rev_8_21_14_0_10_39_11]